MPLVVSNALCACVMGAAPATLEVLPIAMVTGSAMPAGNITSAIPFADVLPFGVCISMANPAVAAATAAALGVLVPMPCTPMTSAWVPGAPTVTIGGPPALDTESIAPCSFGGVVSISFSGQVTVDVP